MIGISVSYCIREIVEGIVQLKDVQKIVSGIFAPTDGAMEEVIRSYRETHWSDYPDKAEKIFRKLLEDGKIEQPRSFGMRHFPILGTGKHWVESEEEIIWADAESFG